MQTWAATKLDKASEVVQPCRLRRLAEGYSVQMWCVMGTQCLYENPQTFSLEPARVFFLQR